MKIFGYILVIIGTLMGGWQFLDTMTFAESAPQQAAGMAMAMAWAVLPYCFARAVEKIGEVTVNDALERHWRREEEKRAVLAASARLDAQAATPKPPQPPKFHPLTGKPLP